MNQEVKTINGYKIKDEKAIRTYDTVALMKSDTKLKKGQHVKTRGYYSINDGGSAEYYITDTSNNSDYQENLETGLYATLIISNNPINVKLFGAKGDELTNDTQAIQNGINFIQRSNLADTLYFPKGTYLISHIEITQGINLEGESEYYTCLKSIDNNTNNSLIELINTGTFHNYLSNFRINGNMDNNTNEIHGILANITQADLGDRYTNYNHLTISRCTGYGIYLAQNVTTYDFRELRFDNVNVASCKKGIYAESVTDSVFTRVTAHSNVEEGIYINGSNNRIVNCKCFWNGKGTDTILEDAERIPSTAFEITSDTTPVEGKKYYTRSGTGKQNFYYVFSEFTGNDFENDVDYYEMSIPYYKKYAGLVINGERCVVDSCEMQDNFGDGIQVLRSNNSLYNLSCDNNGLITEGTTPVSYESVNKSQLYFGVYIYRIGKCIVTGVFTNHRVNSIGKCQLAPVSIIRSSTLEGDIISSDNVIDDIYCISADMRYMSINVNGIPFNYLVDFNNVAKGENITIYEDSYNGSYIKIIKGIVYLNLMFDDSNNSIIPNDSSNRYIANLPSNCRPPQNLNLKAYLTGNHGYNLGRDVTVNIASGGNITLRGTYDSSDVKKTVLIQTCYSLV